MLRTAIRTPERIGRADGIVPCRWADPYNPPRLRSVLSRFFLPVSLLSRLGRPRSVPRPVRRRCVHAGWLPAGTWGWYAGLG